MLIALIAFPLLTTCRCNDTSWIYKHLYILYLFSWISQLLQLKAAHFQHLCERINKSQSLDGSTCCWNKVGNLFQKFRSFIIGLLCHPFVKFSLLWKFPSFPMEISRFHGFIKFVVRPIKTDKSEGIVYIRMKCNCPN